MTLAAMLDAFRDLDAYARYEQKAIIEKLAFGFYIPKGHVPPQLDILRRALDVAPLGFKFNPYHDDLGRFTFGPGDIQEVADMPEATNRTAGGVTYSDKIKKQAAKRGWSDELIDEAVENGEQVPAVNKYNGNPAVRYVSPTTGQSVVVDKVTGQVVQVQGPGFRQGVGSGDVAPSSPTEPTVTEEPTVPELPEIIIPPIIE